MAEADQAERQVLDRERQRREALVADDMAGLADLLADDLVHVHTTGVVNDKAMLLKHAGKILRFYDVRRDGLSVRLVSPDVAVMTGGMTNVVGKRGTEERVEVEAFVTQVWARDQGSWRLRSFHATRTAQ